MNNTDKLISRLNELSVAVTKGKEGIDREFYMSVPARPDHDADLVLSDAAMKIAELTKQRDRAKKCLTGLAVMLSDRYEKLDQDLELNEGDDFKETEIRLAEVSFIISQLPRIRDESTQEANKDG